MVAEAAPVVATATFAVAPLLLCVRTVSRASAWGSVSVIVVVAKHVTSLPLRSRTRSLGLLASASSI